MGAAKPLPPWAVEPLDRKQAAAALGVSLRTLTDKLKTAPHYERRGNRQVFYPEHIALLREAFSCPTSPSKADEASGKPLAPSGESEFDKALALVTAKEPKSSARNSRRGSGRVIPMGRRPSAPSPKP